MNEKDQARFFRLGVIRQQFNAGNLTKDEALELLAGPLTPGNELTIVDDRSFLEEDMNMIYDILENGKKPVIYEIKLSEKYILVTPWVMSGFEASKLREAIDKWMDSESRIFVLGGDAQLVKVDTDQLKKAFDELSTL
jgi:hypothetical protein